MSEQNKVIIGDCTLYLADCMDVLPTLGKVDAVVTDPPYGIKVDSTMAKQSGQQYGNAAAQKSTYKATEWDEEPLSGELLQMVLQSAPKVILWGGNYFALPPTSCWLIWDKENGQNNFADCEMAWTNLPKAVRLKRHLWNGMLRKNGEERCGHPTQKPIEVMTWCLEQLSDSQIVLDPFMGSGTTGVACVKMGRKFIGIEREPEYFEIACKRIREAYAQPDMFIEPPKPMQQDVMSWI